MVMTSRHADDMNAGGLHRACTSGFLMNSVSLPATTARLMLPRWLLLVLVFLLAVVLRHGATINDDVSWCVTLAEKVLDGERLYVDLIEINPPATMFLYVIPVLMERLSGLPAESFVDALVFLAAAISLWLSSHIMRGSGIDGDAGWTLASVVAAALLILPVHTFGEREHIALITFVPLLAAAARRAKGEALAQTLAIAAGIGGGITAIIKPHFAAAIICTAAVAALHARSWRAFFALENWIAAALLAAYAALVVAAYPQFVSDVLPMVMALYVPAKIPFATILIDFATPIWLAATALTVLLKRRAVLAPPFSLLLAASIGFLLAFYVQQKGWPYQSYPMLALALIALAWAVIEQWWREPFPPLARQFKRLAAGLSASLIVAASIVWLHLQADTEALAAAVGPIMPHPKIMALSGYLWTGFPLTRTVHGTWVGRVSMLWITGGVWYRRQTGDLDWQTAARLDAYAARDRTMFAEDLARRRPDVIVVDRRSDRPWMAWVNSSPPLAAQMAHYRPYRSIEGFDILRREPDR
jgi:hypothetical protein